MSDADRLRRAMASSDGALTEREAIERQCLAIVEEFGLGPDGRLTVAEWVRAERALVAAIQELAEASDVNPEPSTGRCLGVEVRAPQQDIRPSVLHFAYRMEERLRKHDAKRGERGWTSEEIWLAVRPGDLKRDVEWLYGRLIEEVAELRKALDLDMYFPPVMKWTEEAADVANFAMMIADVSGGLLGVEQKMKGGL
jgi:NTP pyrophosphatase (non-canonical NTP hydrolase)